MTDTPCLTFEAQLWAVRHSITKKEEKTVITLHVHPSDGDALMNINLLNKRFQVAMAAIGDDEEPASLEGPFSGEVKRRIEAKTRRKFSELPRSAQAGMLVREPEFWPWFEGVANKDRTYDQYRIIDAFSCDGVLKKYLCIKSKKELDGPYDEDRHGNWDRIVASYYQDTGRTAEMRG